MIGNMLAAAQARGKADSLLHLLKKRRWALPVELVAAIQSCGDAAQLDR